MIEMDDDDSAQVHKLVWLNRQRELQEKLGALRDAINPDSVNTISSFPINRRFRGITPLCLAIMLGRRECVHILLENGASCLVATSAGFYPLSEAVSLGDRSVLRDVIVHRLAEIRGMAQTRNPRLLKSLQKDLRDFYIELRWNFHSWLPFFASFLPNDTCRIWKRGSKVRIDSTLKGLEGYRWHRGDISFIISVESDTSLVYVVDHERKVFDEVNQLRDYVEGEMEQAVNSYLNIEIVCAKLHKTSKEGTPIEFKPKMRKDGWFSGKTSKELLEETISGYPCHVYDIKNVRWVTKKRHEHIRDRPSGHKHLPKQSISDHLESMDDDPGRSDEQQVTEHQETVNDIIKGYKESMLKHVDSLPLPELKMSFEEYFGEKESEEYVHVGRPMELTVKEKSLHASVWMSDKYPLSIEELIPLFGLIAPTSKQFQKLVEFIETDLPSGFPVQIDVPIFSLLSAICTFANFTEWTDDISQRPNSRPGDSPDSWFEIPEDYVSGTIIKNIYEKD